MYNYVYKLSFTKSLYFFSYMDTSILWKAVCFKINFMHAILFKWVTKHRMHMECVRSVIYSMFYIHVYRNSFDVGYRTLFDVRYGASFDVQYRALFDVRYQTLFDGQYRTTFDVGYRASFDIRYRNRFDVRYRTSFDV